MATTRVATASRSFFQRRPLVSSTLLTGAGIASYAFWTETQAERRLELARLNNSTIDNANIPTLPRVYDWDAIQGYWSARPVTTAQRLFEILSELAPLAATYVKDFKLNPDSDENVQKQRQQELASRLREALTNLGPAFVKAGQQLSIRPDLVSAVVLKELQRLCDSVRPFDNDVALKLLQEELQQNLDELFVNTPRLVASASLGQVYKATLKENGEEVAIKVQRPGMLTTFSLDLFLLQRIGILVDAFTAVFTEQPPFHKALYESFAKGSYSELDYQNEAKNQLEFQSELQKRNCPVVVPNVYEKLTTRYILTTQWIDGIKLADADKDTIQRLIPVGVELFLTQLLDLGMFHADPHPGNLLVNPKGQLCLLDYGLCAEVDAKSRNAMTKAIVHLVTQDFDSLISQDAKELGFLPDDFDTEELKPLLTKILTVGLVESGSDLRKRKRKLQEISNELNEVFFRYPFSVPPFFALVTRGLGLLEGIALSGDPEFDIFQASAPYARRRAVSLLGPQYFRILTRTKTKSV